MKVNNKSEVRVIGFIVNENSNKCGPVPDDYMSNENDFPIELLNDMKKNGWTDAQGNVWWSKDFQPQPKFGKDGNVYLCLSDEDMKRPKRYLERMGQAIKMLNQNL